MKKVWITFFIGGIAGATVYLSGFGYLFKAIGKNLKKGSLTPSTDDEDKFSSREVPTQNSQPWKKDSAYNKQALSETISEELKKTGTSSLVVIRDNKLMHEQYWKDHNSDSLLNSFSMAKGILSLLIGFALDDKLIDSEDQLVASIFPKYAESHYGKFLTIRHLMTMQAAFDWDEEYRHPFSENSKQYFIDDLAEQALNVDLKEMPGVKYEYQSVSAQLLGLILIKVTGRDLASYLSEKLWKPLEMEHSAKWSTDKKGVEKAFCCIHATTRDFAKIGQLVMQKGKWNGKQILSQQFCKKLITPTQENNAFCYNIWAHEDHTIPYYFFYGFLGQFIIMIREKKMVIVKTGLYNDLEVDEKKRPLQVKLLVDELSTIF
ncbi:serine hydrolase domain-containing protein [Chryseobacterium caseinilyticum]|uniref:Serine hydrolase n=1 Tax=Chryseobacterium caseinilyticum TaxID=2771428 RepID=A0ABR8Z8E5_9FLAO|nr:serine hydrolase [Chryseobacterium caseinilyticum]MBD8081498.1 serine hydrolase [Chryseobacterium caseinilyticum]